ncbi:MAG: potassium channel family protein [Methylobacteriaceae bacterium]|nr:potassium channel family protein [Methylobacteriaceae bacterium]
MYPKARLDALTDGIFAVAMTLLVLELRVPDQPLSDNAGLWLALKDLWPKFFPYLLSFLVLGNSWLSKIRVRMAAEHVTRAYAIAWLADLLLVTCVPFSTMLVGRYADVPLAIWVYVGNLALNGVTALAMVMSMPEAHQASAERRGGVIVLIASCALAAIIAVFAPQHALWALMLNAVPVFAYVSVSKRRSAPHTNR